VTAFEGRACRKAALITSIAPVAEGDPGAWRCCFYYNWCFHSISLSFFFPLKNRFMSLHFLTKMLKEIVGDTKAQLD
jgi:hypothetical protein